jgi:Domain of unknown function (DUF4281)
MARLFELSTIAVLPLWLLMILLPSWPWTRRLMRSPLIAALPAALYPTFRISLCSLRHFYDSPRMLYNPLTIRGDCDARPPHVP